MQERNRILEEEKNRLSSRTTELEQEVSALETQLDEKSTGLEVILTPSTQASNIKIGETATTRDLNFDPLLANLDPLYCRLLAAIVVSWPEPTWVPEIAFMGNWVHP